MDSFKQISMQTMVQPFEHYNSRSVVINTSLMIMHHTQLYCITDMQLRKYAKGAKGTLFCLCRNWRSPLGVHM